MKKIFSVSIGLLLILSAFSAAGLFVRSGAAADETGMYVTRRELAKIIAKETGEREGVISEFMFSKGLDENATMSDLIEILFQSGMLKKDVEENKTFLGKPIIRIYK